MKILVTLIAAVTLGVAAVSPEKTQIENVPEQLSMYGEYDDPIDVDPADPMEEVKWTLINNTPCDLVVKQWYEGFDGVGNPLTPNRLIYTIPSTNIQNVTSGDIRSLFPSATNITVTHGSIMWKFVGMSSFVNFTHGNINPHQVNTGLPVPCDCVRITLDEVTKTTTFDPC